jgi:ABC-type protease/lipase transport system fused ATPase/permease subunit
VLHLCDELRKGKNYLQVVGEPKATVISTGDEALGEDVNATKKRGRQSLTVRESEPVPKKAQKVVVVFASSGKISSNH